MRNAHNVSYDIRQEVFQKTVNLSGAQFDSFGLPSLISRLTSDSYNVQSAVQQLHTLCVRAPMLLAGGVAVTLVMDASLALVLAAMLPVLLLVVLTVSAKGLPMYRQVQQKLDGVVRVMRENITGIRVVKALSKTEYEKRRFARANDAMADSGIAAGTVMAIPSPFMQLCLNGGLTLVVFIGAGRVDGGTLEPGVILAFLTYFNMIAMGVMGLSRIFMTMSRAMASADRIDQVLQTRPGQQVLPPGQARTPAGPGFLRFEHVGFSYGEGDGSGENSMNPTAVVEMDEGGYMEMETTQIKGVDSTVRTTTAKLGPNATLIIKEKVMTHGKQLAKSDFTVDLDGEGCHTNVISRSVARDRSKQIFLARINGNAACYGHSECDAIIMDEGVVSAIPEVTANCLDAQLVHEAAIGKIAGEQLTKLMTLGLTEKEAEEQIVNGFLK